MKKYHRNKQVMWDNLEENDQVVFHIGPEVEKATVLDKKRMANMVYIVTEDGKFIWTDIYHLISDEEAHYMNNLGERVIKDIDYVFSKYNIQNIFELMDLLEI